jgi:hypothetical protein
MNVGKYVVWHSSMHLCAKYSHIIMNYARDMSMTLIIWIQRHACFINDNIFVQVFFYKIRQNPPISVFLERTTCQRIPYFDIFFILFGFLKIGSKSHTKLCKGRAWIFQHPSMMSTSIFIDTIIVPTATQIQRPITRARAKQINYRVLWFLESVCYS